MKAAQAAEKLEMKLNAAARNVEGSIEETRPA